MIEPEIISQKILADSMDLEELRIIDWHRFHPYWKTASEAIRALGTIMRGHFAATLVKYDTSQEPPRDDFPADWEHVGSPHHYIARRFWNMYYNHGMGELSLGDKPDFVGTFRNNGNEVNMAGDFGQVSPFVFLTTVDDFRVGDLWIGVPSHQYQVILECVQDFRQLKAAVADSVREAIGIPKDFGLTAI